MSLTLKPITRKEARLFVAQHHRHNRPPSSSVFQIGAEKEGALCGVVIGAIPLARKLMDGYTLEITRVATNGQRNACSFLYGAACRAGKALGYRRVFTYTLISESGSSLKASGWLKDKELNHNPKGWDSRQERRSLSTDLFGNRTTPDEAKVRWVKHL